MSLPKAKLTKLILTELAAVATGAQEVQGTAILKRKDARPTEVRKQSAMTTATQGHQHLLYCVDETQSGSTSYESSYVEGQPGDYYTGHCHPWIRNADGSITIGESLGHTHDVGAMSASLAKATGEKPTTTEKSSATAREKSTRSNVVSQPALTHTEKSTMDPKDQEIASLKKTLAGLIALSSAEHAHYKTLSGDEQAAFLAKSAEDRGAVVAAIAKRTEEAEKVVYVSKANGDIFRAKDDPRMVEMAKREDAALEKIEKAELVSFAKANMNNIPGDDETHAYIVKSIRKGGGSTELIAKAEAAIKGANAETKVGKKAPGADGANPADGDDTPLAKFNVKLAEFAKSKNQTPVEATGAFVETPEGASLYDELLASQH